MIRRPRVLNRLLRRRISGSCRPVIGRLPGPHLSAWRDNELGGRFHLVDVCRRCNQRFRNDRRGLRPRPLGGSRRDVPLSIKRAILLVVAQTQRE